MRPALLVIPALLCLLAACAPADTPTALAPAGTAIPSGAALPAGVEADPAARLARAPAATAAALRARTTTLATVSGLPGRPEPITFQGEGAIDFAAGRSRSTLDLAGALSRGASGDAEVETVVADGVVYVRAPTLSSLSGTTAPWVRIRPGVGGSGGASEAGLGLGLGPLGRLAGSDTGAPLALLAGVDASSVRVRQGEEGTEGGITHLRGSVDLLAAADSHADPGDLAALQAFLDGLGARKLHLEVELDQDDRVRRIAYEHEVATSTGTARQRFEVAYSDFGAAVEIEVPPDDQVRDLS